MDNDFTLDYGEIIKTVRNADVLTFRFVIVSERLLIDNRPLASVPPPALMPESSIRLYGGPASGPLPARYP